jgi:hypothetical protein
MIWNPSSSSLLSLQLVFAKVEYGALFCENDLGYNVFRQARESFNCFATHHSFTFKGVCVCVCMHACVFLRNAVKAGSDSQTTCLSFRAAQNCRLCMATLSLRGALETISCFADCIRGIFNPFSPASLSCVIRQLPFCFLNKWPLHSVKLQMLFYKMSQRRPLSYDDTHKPTHTRTRTHPLWSSRSLPLWLFWPKPYSQC